MIISAKKFIGMFSNFVLWFFYCAILVSFWDKGLPSTTEWEWYIINLVVISIAFNFIYVISMSIPIYDFRVVYIILNYLFIFGRVLLAALDLEYEASWWLQDYFTDVELFRTALLSLACSQAIFLGLFIVEHPKDFGFNSLENDSLLQNKTSDTVDECTDRVLLYTGVAILVIALPCRVILDIRSIIASLATGWYEAASGITGLWDDFGFWFIPGMLCIMESLPKKRIKLIIVIFVYYLLVMCLTGDRRYYVTAIVALGCYYITCRSEKKKVKPLLIAAVMFVGIVFLNFLEIVRHSRYGGIGNLSYFISTYGPDLFNFENVFIDVFSEFGITFYSVAVITTNVPGLLSFQYGKTLLASFASLIPLGTSIITYPSSPSDLINGKVGLPVGGTVFGDLYANFGLWGVLVTFIFGIILSKWFAHCKNSSRYSRELSMVLYFSSFYLLLNLVRATIAEVVRPIVWCTCIILILYSTLSKRANAR